MKIKNFFIIIALIILGLCMVGCPSNPPSSDTITIGGLEKPQKPQDISATKGLKNTTISWKKDSSVEYYNIYKARNLDGSFSKYSVLYTVDFPGDEMVFVDDMDSSGSISLYYVEAVKNVVLGSSKTTMLISDPSDIAIGSTTPRLIVQPPRASSDMKVTWMTYGTHNGANCLYSDISFKLFKNGKLLAETTELGFKDEDILPDTEYSYYVEMLYKLNPEDTSFSSITSEPFIFKTSTNYIPEAVKHEAISMDNLAYAIAEDGSLESNIAKLAFYYDIPVSLVSNPAVDAPITEENNAKAVFRIERINVRTGESSLVCDYDDNSMITAVLDGEHDCEATGVYRYRYTLVDENVESGEEYRYRFYVRYVYSTDWYETQLTYPTETNDTIKIIDVPRSIILDSKNESENEEERTLSTDIVWNVSAGYENDELKYILERKNTYLSSSEWELVADVAVNDTLYGRYVVHDEFSIPLVELEDARSYQYRLSLVDIEGKVTSPNYILSEDQLYTEGTKTVFDVVEKDSLTATRNLFNRIDITWKSNLKPEELSGTVLDAEKFTFSIYSSDGGLIKEGKASDFNPMDEGDYISFSFTDEVHGAVKSYYLIAEYNDAENNISSISQTKTISGKSLIAIDKSSADIAANTEIAVSFLGDSDAKAFKLYYRYKDEMDWKDSSLVITNAETENNPSDNISLNMESYTFNFSVLNDDQENRGRHIEFHISMQDESGSFSEPDNIVHSEGSFFGAYGMTVTASQAVTDGIAIADRVNLSWSEVEGATSYLIYKSLYEDKDYMFIESFQFDDGGLSGADRLTEKDNMGGYFYYKVVPVSEETTLDINSIEPTIGTFFAPPKNIKASKGERVEEINITWDKVDWASGYNIYRRAKLYDDPWEKIASVGNVDSYIDAVDVDADYEYTIESKYANSAISFKQNSFVEDSNVGYAFFNVSDNIRIEDEGGKCKLTWVKVKGATNYKIHLYDRIENGVVSPVYIDVPDSKDESNMMSCLISDSIYKFIYDEDIIILPPSVISENEYLTVKDDKIKGIYPSFGLASTRINIYENDLISLINETIREYLVKADSNWRGDWWAPDSGWWGSVSEDVNTYTEETIYIKSAKGGGTYTEQSKDPGYIELKYLPLKKYLNFQLNTGNENKIGLWAEDSASSDSGYRGIDPLSIVGFEGRGKIEILLNNISTGLFLSYNNINVYEKNRSGSYKLFYDDTLIADIKDSSNISRIFN